MAALHDDTQPGTIAGAQGTAGGADAVASCATPGASASSGECTDGSAGSGGCADRSAGAPAPSTPSSPASPASPASIGRIVSLGGGHGLFATLRAARTLSDNVTAVVTVADDGGSSGRLRREFGTIPPGDLRMALAALAADDRDGRLWEALLQHRFGGRGALAGHAVGNLIIQGLRDILGSDIEALDEVGRLLRIRGRVVPMSTVPLDIEAEVAGLEHDPRVVTQVRGQVAVASTIGQVRRVKLIPENPPAAPEAIEAIQHADLVTLGPGSWFSSVIPHILVPEIVEALNSTSAHKVVIVNLVAEPGETPGFSVERHLHMLEQHCHSLQVDTVLVDERTVLGSVQRDHLRRAAQHVGAELVLADVQRDSAERFGSTHSPQKLAAALRTLMERA